MRGRWQRDATQRPSAAGADATALVPSDKAGLDLSSGGFGLRAAAFSKTPFADALSDMLRDAVAQLHQRLREG